MYTSTNTMTDEEIKTLVKIYRITLQQIADRANCSPPHVRNFLNGNLKRGGNMGKGHAIRKACLTLIYERVQQTSYLVQPIKRVTT